MLLLKDPMWSQAVVLFHEGKKAIAFVEDKEINDPNCPTEFFLSGKNLNDGQFHILLKAKLLWGNPPTSDAVLPAKEQVDIKEKESDVVRLFYTIAKGN